MEPLDFGGAKQCQTIALLMGVAHPHTFVVICFPAYSTVHTALFSMVNDVPCFVSMYE